MNKKEDKKIITIQLPNDLYLELIKEAEKNTLTLSAYLRLLILQRNEKTNN